MGMDPKVSTTAALYQGVWHTEPLGQQSFSPNDDV